MDKLKMKSVDKVSENIRKIKELFPNCVTEVFRNGIATYAIDFEALSQELSEEIIISDEQRYQMTWAGKTSAILKANMPIASTLRPCREESVDFDKTHNLYIEGDNLDVLKLLQETYMGKVKVIYIDPPYNTGKDSFLYDDDMSISEQELKERSGLISEQGDRLFGKEYKENNESNGKFHTDWLNMIYPRLKLSKDLLLDDGVIMISMDESEIENLLKVANEIFGRHNYIGQFIWQNRTTPNDSQLFFAPIHEFVVVYAKNLESVQFKGLEKDMSNYKNLDNDPNGPWIKDNPSAASGSERDRFAILNPYTLEEYFPPKGRYWAFSQKRVKEWEESGKLVFPKESGKNFVLKKYQKDLKSENKPMPSIISDILTMHGTKEMAALFPEDDRVFKYPKPTKLIKLLLEQASNKDSIILDFFSGSAPTADAVMQLNAQDGGERKFILVQLNEKCDEDSESYKAGYKDICEVGKERVRRAGRKISQENQMMLPNLDIGFRVLKLDSSNMKDVYYRAEQYSQNLLEKYESNIKEERVPQDLLFQIMLDMGVLLSSKIEEKEIAGKKVFIVGEYTNNIQPNLIACFDENLSNDVVTVIAKMKPLYAVFRDSSFASDSVATNFEQIFTTYSPTTERKVI